MKNINLLFGYNQKNVIICLNVFHFGGQLF